MIELLRKLIQIPSENNGVTGYEKEVQRFYHCWLLDHGIPAEWIEPEKIPGFDLHPARLLEHDMRNRPLVIAQIRGKRPGKNRLLLAHADTVPVGILSNWQESPFSGRRENGRIYGCGSGDDKWGMAVMAGVALAAKNRRMDFPGILTIASVPDEESGGGNGIAALLASGIQADEAVYLDGGSNQSIWHAGLGGGFCLVSEGNPEKIHQEILATKNGIHQQIERHPCFGKDFFQIIEKQFFLIWKTQDGLSFLHDTLPGEDEETLKRNFENRLPGCQFRWMSRFLKPALIPKDAPLVRRLAESFHRVTGRTATICAGLQSDQGLLTTFGNIPCVLFGCSRRGLPGAPHLPGEFIEEKSFLEVFETIKHYLFAEESRPLQTLPENLPVTANS